MELIQHPTNNDVLAAPPGVSIEDCTAAPITRVTQDGRNEVWTFWKPDADELVALNAGKCVVLGVWGRTMPPVFVAVEA
nr:hypothetical protein [uncultured Roseateles sp.]